MSETEKIREFVQNNLAALFDEGSTPADDDNLFELGFVDSLFAIQLVSFVEQEFGIQMSEEDLDIANFSSINRVVAFVMRKRKL